MGRECPQPQCAGYFKVKPGTGIEKVVFAFISNA